MAFYVVRQAIRIDEDNNSSIYNRYIRFLTTYRYEYYIIINYHDGYYRAIYVNSHRSIIQFTQDNLEKWHLDILYVIDNPEGIPAINIFKPGTKLKEYEVRQATTEERNGKIKCYRRFLSYKQALIYLRDALNKLEKSYPDDIISKYKELLILKDGIDNDICLSNLIN